MVFFGQGLIERGVALDGVQIQSAAKLVVGADKNFNEIGIEARVIKAVGNLEIA